MNERDDIILNDVTVDEMISDTRMGEMGLEHEHMLTEALTRPKKYEVFLECCRVCTEQNYMYKRSDWFSFGYFIIVRDIHDYLYGPHQRQIQNMELNRTTLYKNSDTDGVHVICLDHYISRWIIPIRSCPELCSHLHVKDTHWKYKLGPEGRSSHS